MRRRLAGRYRWWRGAGRGFGHRPDLAVAFLERAVELAAPGGVVAMLVPAKLATAGYGAAARHALAASTTLIHVADLTGSRDAAFDATVYPLALVARKAPPPRRPSRAHDSARLVHRPAAMPAVAALRGGGPWVLDRGSRRERPPRGSRASIRRSASDSPASSASRPAPTGCFSTRPPTSSQRCSAGPSAAATCGRSRSRARVAAALDPRPRRRAAGPTPAATPPRTSRRHAGAPPGARGLRGRAGLDAVPDARGHRARTGSSGRISRGASPPARSPAGGTRGRVPLNTLLRGRAGTAEQAERLAAWLNATWVRALALIGAMPAAGGFHRFAATTVVSGLPLPPGVLADPDHFPPSRSPDAAASRCRRHSMTSRPDTSASPPGPADAGPAGGPTAPRIVAESLCAVADPLRTSLRGGPAGQRRRGGSRARAEPRARGASGLSARVAAARAGAQLPSRAGRAGALPRRAARRSGRERQDVRRPGRRQRCCRAGAPDGVPGPGRAGRPVARRRRAGGRAGRGRHAPAGESRPAAGRDTRPGDHRREPSLPEPADPALPRRWRRGWWVAACCCSAPRPIVNRLDDLAHQLLLGVRDDALLADGSASPSGRRSRRGEVSPRSERSSSRTRHRPGPRPARLAGLSRRRPPSEAGSRRAGDREHRTRLRLSAHPPIAALVRGVLAPGRGVEPGRARGRAAALSLRSCCMPGTRARRDAQLTRAELRGFAGELDDQLVLWALHRGRKRRRGGARPRRPGDDRRTSWPTPPAPRP